MSSGTKFGITATMLGRATPVRDATVALTGTKAATAERRARRSAKLATTTPGPTTGPCSADAHRRHAPRAGPGHTVSPRIMRLVAQTWL